MKKSILILLSLLIVGGAFAQKAPTTKLISSSEERIVVQVDLNGFNTIKAQTPQGEQFIISVPKMAANLEAGTPDLPTFPVPTIIGDRAEMTVNVINAQYTDYTNMEIAPSKGNISRQNNPNDIPYTYGDVYQQNAFWPASQAYLEAPYILRDFRGQNIMVRPFAFNPVTKTLRVYESLTIEMTKVSDNGVNQKTARKSNTIKTDPDFKAQYNRRFINYNETGAKYIFDEDFGEMLIICTDAYMSNLQPLVDWKNQSGRPTTLVSLSTAGGNNIENIKNYVSSFYNDPAHNLEYVLLVGEYNDITPKNLGYGSGGTVCSDNYIGKLEGNDDYLEVLIGRLSVSNAADADLQVNKIIYYERDVTADATWGNKGMGIGYYGAGSGHYDEDDYQHIDLIRDTLLHYTYETITEHHGGSGGDASVATISGTINQGIGIINYCNHGNWDSWGVANYSVSNVNALTNNGMLPIVWSVACLNGQFDNGTCFAESWLRANQNGNPTGAVAGMFSYVSQPWIPPMYGQDEMVDILTGWRNVDQFNHTMGGASLNGSMYVIDMAPGDAYQTFNAWLLFGDPSLMLRTDIPVAMNVTASPAVLMVGMTSLDLNADTEYGIATLSMNGEIIASSRVVNGQCTLEFPALSNVGQADLVIMGYNKVTYRSTIDVIVAEGAYITLNAFEMGVDQANYGETIDMNINIKNVGVEAAQNLTATLSTSSEYVEILSGECAVSAIDPDEVVTLEGFQFSVAEDVPDKTDAPFTLSITDGTNTWESTFTVKLHAPVITVESVQAYMEEEMRYLQFSFQNTGSAPFYGGTLNIYSSSADITIDPTTIVFEDVIEGGEAISLTTNYVVDENVVPGSTYEIAYDMTSGLYNASGIYILSIGAIQEDFESGEFGSQWTMGPEHPWVITEGGVKGYYCAKSGNSFVHNSESYMVLTVEVLAPGELTFSYKVSSENNYDKLRFYMDNQEKGNWSGTVEWSQFTQPVTAGTHSFKWSYSKDSSVSSGSDCAWIDDIVFPPTSVVTFIEPISNLEASVELGMVTLTWSGSEDATSYIVMCDGEEVSTVTDTVFSEIKSEGQYVYSIIAKNDENQTSVPTSITVVVDDYTYVAENNNLSVRVYPNPVSNTLFIEGVNTTYSYVMYNNMGQQVANGRAQGVKQINVNGMSKGVYFLHVTTGAQVSVQKVVVE